MTIPRKGDRCFWGTGCANSERCREFGSCIARYQNQHKDELFSEPAPPESEHNKAAGLLALILRKLALLDESEDGCSCELQLFSDESWNIESELRSRSIASGNDLDSLYKFCDSTALLAEKQEEI